MLTSLVLTLVPEKDTALTIHSGRLMHGAFLDFVRQHDPALSERLHDPEEDKPFTVSSLRGAFEREEQGRVAVQGRSYWARVTTLERMLSRVVHEQLTRGTVLQIGDRAFEVKDVAACREEDPWAAVSSYKDLYNDLVATIADPPFRTTLTFESPTTFRSEGVNLPLPVPRLVFRNYYEKWNRYSPIFLGEDLGEAIERRVQLTRYETKTQMVHFGGAHQEVGFVGTCTFTIPKRAGMVFAMVIELLSSFAFFCGTGAKTTMGMGQTRRVEGS